MAVSILDLVESAPASIKKQFYYKRYSANTQIISSTGVSDTYLYIITSGVAEVYKASSCGAVISVNTFSAGDVFGEVEIFSPDFKPYNVHTKTDCTIILVKKETVYQWMREVFEFNLFLCEMLTRRMYLTSDSMSRIALLPIKERVLGFISSHYLNGTLDTLTKEELVAQVRAPLRSINRVIKLCTHEGLIEYKKKKFHVKDVKKLSEFFDVYNV